MILWKNKKIICVMKVIIKQLSTAEKVIELFKGEKADLVVCDGAPDGMSMRIEIIRVLIKKINFYFNKNIKSNINNKLNKN